ncbi:hypothetical protein BH09SUM1_BH09SUM1_31920 [soil metagenome]
MKIILSLIILLAAMPMAMAAVVVDEKKPVPELPEFNRLVLEQIGKFPTNGEHKYWWPKHGESKYDGVSEDIFLNGEKVLSGEPKQQTFCCGLTLEVYMKAYEAWAAKHGQPAHALKPADIPKFRTLWFVEDANGPGPSVALEQFHLGKTVTMEQALPGDFVQLWRHSGSGHSVIFLDWVKDEKGEITGMKYWSTQTSTDGIHENEEHFGPKEEKSKKMAKEFLFIGRGELTAPPAENTETSK